MKRFKYLAFLLWMMPLAFGACTDDDNDEIPDEESRYHQLLSADK